MNNQKNKLLWACYQDSWEITKFYVLHSFFFKVDIKILSNYSESNCNLANNKPFI